MTRLSGKRFTVPLLALVFGLFAAQDAQSQTVITGRVTNDAGAAIHDGSRDTHRLLCRRRLEWRRRHSRRSEHLVRGLSGCADADQCFRRTNRDDRVVGRVGDVARDARPAPRARERRE